MHFNLYTALMKHVNKCRAPEMNNSDDSLSSDEPTNDNQSPFSAIEAPYRYVSEYRIAVCMICKTGVFKEHLEGHARRKHKTVWPGRNGVWNQCIWKTDDIPILEQQVDYLPVSKQAPQCMLCLKIYPNPHSTRHHRYEIKHQVYQICTAINIFKTKVLWQRLTSISQEQLEASNSIRELLQSTTQLHESSNWTNVPQCFVTLSWLQFVNGFNHQEIQIFTKLYVLRMLDSDRNVQGIQITPQWIESLLSLCSCFLENVNDNMDSTNYYTRLQITSLR